MVQPVEKAQGLAPGRPGLGFGPSVCHLLAPGQVTEQLYFSFIIGKIGITPALSAYDES